MVGLLSVMAVFGLLIVIWLILLHRELRGMRSLLNRMPGRSSRHPSPETIETEPPDPDPIPRQIIHDLNNLLGTMGGFAEAAMEDLGTDDPIKNDLREICEAAERAKGVVKRLSRFSPPKSDDSAPSEQRPPPRSRSVTATYELPTRQSDLFNRPSSYPPIAKPVPAYRKPSRPPLAKPVISDRHPVPPVSRPSATAGDDTQNTSSFPVPSMSHVNELVRRHEPSILKETSEFAMPRAADTATRANLLIVDDEVQLLTMFRRVFEPQGYMVTTFSDSIDALSDFQVNADKYDLAILDQRMPEMSGSSLAAQMINLRPEFPIILLTGYSDTVSPEDVARIGIRKYLSKPIPQAKLSAMIRSLLDETSELTPQP